MDYNAICPICSVRFTDPQKDRRSISVSRCEKHLQTTHPKLKIGTNSRYKKDRKINPVIFK